MLSNQLDNRIILSQNFNTVGHSQTKLSSFKVKKMDACIRPLFANPVTFYVHNCAVFKHVKSQLYTLYAYAD